MFEEEERMGVEDDHQWIEDGPEEQRHWGGQMVRFMWWNTSVQEKRRIDHKF